MALRLFKDDPDTLAEMVALAAHLCSTPLTVSIDPSDKREGLSEKLSELGAGTKVESLASFIESMPSYERIRTCSPDIPIEMYQRAAATNPKDIVTFVKKKGILHDLLIMLRNCV